ncbi:zinc finger protein 839 [Ranitomeya imitator]|uniref:zinc finger protein 839 n=1 Tax=Ranitomeya imitator TaxID=111125 RepID=UPI0037E757BA
MAALGCPGNMAEVVSAAVQEYVQMMVEEPGQVVVVHEGGGGDALSPEILQSISHSDTVFYVQPDGSLVPGGRLLNGGRVLEAAQHEVRLEAGGRVMEAAVVESAGVEAAVVESAAMESAFVESAAMEAAFVESAAMEAAVVESAAMEAAVVESATMEAAVVESAAMEAAHSGMVLVGAPGVVDAGEEDMAMESALNLTMEATDRGREAATTLAGSPNMATHRGLVSAIGGPTPIPQLQTVAHPVVLREGALTSRIPETKLNPIHVQVPGLQVKKSADPVVLNLSGIHVKNTSPGLVGSQIVQIKSLSNLGKPLVVNASTLESPIQILVRSAQLSTAKQRTPDLNRNTGESLVIHSLNGARTLTDHAQNKGHKRKKAIKIKTRSGRISRPPKHKAKDYKFLKVGDLIQDSASDSEDYSELSTDEEEKGVKEKAPCDLLPYTVKNELFQCQTCEKSYMGKGGLSRHYRLYPSHGHMEPSLVSDAKKNRESGVGGNFLPGEPKKPTPRPKKRLLEDPLNPDHSRLLSLDNDGLEFASVSTTCQGRQQITARRFGRPRKALAIASSKQNALQAKELIQHCEDADIREHVAPCLSGRLSVCDYSLVKVKQEHPDEPLFPHLYKELEKLHSMVRMLAAEYFSSGVGKTLEVTDSKVAASLDVSAEQIAEVSLLPEQCSEEQRIQSEDGNNECSTEEMMPPSKRSKVDETESERPTPEMSTENTVYIHEEEQTQDLMTDELLCGNDTSSDVTINCTIQVCETSLTNVMEEEAKELPVITTPASIPCGIEQDVMATAPPLLGGESGDSVQISTDRSAESPGDECCSHITQEGTRPNEVLPGSLVPPLPCSPADFALPSDAPPQTITEKTCSESFQGVDALIPPDIIASDSGSQAFDFQYGQDLVFVHHSEGAAVGEAGVIFEPPAHPQDTVAALMEIK